jgi:glycosyltransferase involved in cell wall biosynthesis
MGMESRWRYFLNRMTQGLSDRVVCVSQQVAEFVVRHVGISEAKVVVIPNGVDLGQEDGLSGTQAVRRRRARAVLNLPVDGTLVGTVARLDPVKRLDVLLRALADLEGVLAIVVGYGSEEARLRALAEQLGIADRIWFVGHQRDVQSWLAALDVFVLSSDWEGMSNALLEAMAAHLPVVATATGGTPDVVVEGVTGFLVPPGDAPALAQAIEALLLHPDWRDRMGQAGRQRVVEHFSVEQMVERTQALYQSLLGEPMASWSQRGS